MKSLNIFILVLFLFPVSLLGLNKTENYKEVDIILYKKIPMRDGINLSANIYKPANLKKPLPVLFTLTSYVNAHNQKEAMYFAQNEYIYMSVDLRGRGNSQGEFHPFKTDGQDGYDICAWISQQPWCNGKIAMLGGSYLGMTQWLTLKELPPDLKTIVPCAACAPGIDFPKTNNIFKIRDVQWLAMVSGKTDNYQLYTDQNYWKTKNLNRFKKHVPFSKLDELNGDTGGIFREWLEHPAFDNYWQSILPSKKEYKKIAVPILTITGYYDGDQNGALYYYTEFMKYAPDEAKQKHYLIIGPWDHSGTRKPKRELGGLKFGENAVIDMKKIHLQWFNWIFKDGVKPDFLKDKVCYYNMGGNKWKYAGRLEQTADETVKWYLSSDNGNADDVFHSGKLNLNLKDNQKPDTFEYDPLDTVLAKNYNDFYHDYNDFLTNQSDVFLKGRLIYHSPPFEKDLEISGYIKFKTYMSMNVPDTDFRVDLYEITEDGKSKFLTHDVMRARYRKSLEKEELVKPGEINLYEFKRFPFFSRTISKGSRLRLIIKCINSPNWQKNYNSGGIAAEETAKDARKAVINLFHNKKYPGYIELPVSRKNK